MVEAVVRWLEDDQGHVALGQKQQDAKAVRETLRRAHEMAIGLQESPRTHLSNCIQGVTVRADRVDIELRPDLLRNMTDGQDDGFTHCISVPAKLKRCGGGRSG